MVPEYRPRARRGVSAHRRARWLGDRRALAREGPQAGPQRGFEASRERHGPAEGVRSVHRRREFRSRGRHHRERRHEREGAQLPGEGGVQRAPGARLRRGEADGRRGRKSGRLLLADERRRGADLAGPTATTSWSGAARSTGANRSPSWCGEAGGRYSLSSRGRKRAAPVYCLATMGQFTIAAPDTSSGACIAVIRFETLANAASS